MKEMEPQTKLSLKLQAYQYLKTKILNCEYRPNEFLNEQKLCAEMGNISRTPMRDALGRLEQEGLITILPKKGLMVSGITEEDVHSMFEMRLLVEPYALRTYGADIPKEQLSAFVELMHNPDRIDDFCKSDDDFHELLMSTLPNKYLRSAHDRQGEHDQPGADLRGAPAHLGCSDERRLEHRRRCPPAASGDRPRQGRGRHQGHPPVVSAVTTEDGTSKPKRSPTRRRAPFRIREKFTGRPVPFAAGQGMRGWAASEGRRPRICRT